MLGSIILGSCGTAAAVVFLCLYLKENWKNHINTECITTLFSQAGKAVFFFDPKKRKIISSQSLETVFGRQIAGSFNFYGSMLRLVHEEDRQNVLATIKEIIAGKDVSGFQFRLCPPDSADIWCALTTVTINGRTRHAPLHIATLENIDRRVRQEAELRFKAERDSLTGLYNRLTTEMLITSTLIDRTYKKTANALFMIDIDNLKHINDTYGHICGDKVITRLADCIRMSFRESDILGRVGGDEFVVFLKDCGSKEDICKKAQQLCNTYHSVFSYNTTDIPLSCSVGISCYPGDALSFINLYAAADKALYNAKKSGRNTFAVSSPLLTA